MHDSLNSLGLTDQIWDYMHPILGTQQVLWMLGAGKRLVRPNRDLASRNRGLAPTFCLSMGMSSFHGQFQKSGNSSRIYPPKEIRGEDRLTRIRQREIETNV